MANNNWNLNDPWAAEMASMARLEDAKTAFMHTPTPETLAALQAIGPMMNEENPNAYIMYEILPEAVENDWADVVAFIFHFYDLDPTTLERPDVDINTNNYGAPVGVQTMASLHPLDGSYDTLKVFLEQAHKKGHTWDELEDMYGYIEFFDEIKQEYIEYVENERAKLMYLRKATPSLPNNVLFGKVQGYMTNQPVFNAQREMRARRTDPFRVPVTANNRTRRNNANNRTRRNNANNRWAPNIVQRGGPARFVKKKKQTHRKKRPLRG